MHKIASIGSAIAKYECDHRDAPPPSLSALVDAGYLNSANLSCPIAGGKDSYYYDPMAARPSEDPGGIIACDLIAHPDGTRSVLHCAFDTRTVDAHQFEEELAMPVNAKFLKAWKAAGGR